MASSAVRPAIDSSLRRCSSSATPSRRSFSRRRARSRSARPLSLSVYSARRRSSCSSLRASSSSLVSMRCSIVWISRSRRRVSSSNAARAFSVALARLQLGCASARVRLALGGLDDAAGLALGAADAAVARCLVEEEPDGKREGGDNRQHDPGRVHHRSLSRRVVSVKYAVKIDEFRDQYRGVPEAVSRTRGGGKVPTSAVCRGVSNLASQVGAVIGELQASPSTRGLLTALTYSSRWVNEVETSRRHH